MAVDVARSGDGVEMVVVDGRTYRIPPGPRGEPAEIRSATAAELEELDAVTAGARLVRRTGPCSYVVVR